MENENKNNRNPRNLQGLLRFAMEATKSEDAPSGDHQFQRMDPERRNFLENAIHALTIDVIEQIQTAVATIGSESKTKEEKVEAMTIIHDYIDDIDTANDFCKIGGLCILLPCLNSPFLEIQKMAASLTAEMAQNNPYCQQQLIELDILPHLMNQLTNDDLRVEILRAISCLVRGNTQAFEAFSEIGGIECLLGCLQKSKGEKLIMRTAFLMTSLCTEYALSDTLIKLGAIEMILPLIEAKNEYNACLETLLSLLCSLQSELAKDHLKHQYDFMDTLNEITKLSENKPECNEITEYCHSLLKNNFDLKGDFEIADK